MDFLGSSYNPSSTCFRRAVMALTVQGGGEGLRIRISVFSGFTRGKCPYME